MQYNMLISAIPKDMKKFVYEFKQGKEPLESEDCQKLVYMALCDRPTQLLYKSVNRFSTDFKSKAKAWNEELGVHIDEQTIRDCFANIYKLSNIPNIRSFQYRLLHRAIITNSHLFRWKIRDNNLCSFCHKSKETYVHLFVECPTVQEIWVFMQAKIEKIVCKRISLESTETLLNPPLAEENIVGFLKILVKKYIYRQRCIQKPLSCVEIASIVKKQENMERYIAIKNDKLQIHLKKWRTM